MPESGAGSGNLSREEVARRVKAARILRGWERRDDLAAALKDRYQMSSSRLRLIEDGRAGLQAFYRDKLAEFLELPQSWFTASLEELLPAEGTGARQLDRIEAMLMALLTEEQLDAVVRAWREEEHGVEPENDASAKPG